MVMARELSDCISSGCQVINFVGGGPPVSSNLLRKTDGGLRDLTSEMIATNKLTPELLRCFLPLAEKFLQRKAAFLAAASNGGGAEVTTCWWPNREIFLVEFSMLQVYSTSIHSFTLDTKGSSILNSFTPEELLCLYRPLGYIADLAVFRHGLPNLFEITASATYSCESNGPSSILPCWLTSAILLAQTFTTLEEFKEIGIYPKLTAMASKVFIKKQLREMVQAGFKFVGDTRYHPTGQSDRYLVLNSFLPLPPIFDANSTAQFWKKDLSEGNCAAMLLYFIEDKLVDTIPNSNKAAFIIKALGGMFYNFNLASLQISSVRQSDTGCGRSYAMLAAPTAQVSLHACVTRLLELADAETDTIKEYKLLQAAVCVASACSVSIGRSITLNGIAEVKQQYGGGLNLVMKGFCETFMLAANAWLKLRSVAVSAILQIAEGDRAIFLEKGIQSFSAALWQMRADMFLKPQNFPLGSTLGEPEMFACFMQALEAAALVWGTFAASTKGSALECHISCAVSCPLDDVLGQFLNAIKSQGIMVTTSPNAGCVWQPALRAAQTALGAAMLHAPLTLGDYRTIYSSPYAIEVVTFTDADMKRQWGVMLDLPLTIITTCSFPMISISFLQRSAATSQASGELEKEKMLQLEAAIVLKGLFFFNSLPESVYNAFKMCAMFDSLASMTVKHKARLLAASVDVEPGLKRLHELVTFQNSNQLTRLDNARIGQFNSLVHEASQGPAKGQDAALTARAALLNRLDCAYVGCTTLRPGTDAATKKNRCSGCRSVRYCGPVCQKKDWKVHKHACKLLAQESK